MVAFRVLAPDPRVDQLTKIVLRRNSSFILSLRFFIDSSFVSGEFASTDDPNASVAFRVGNHQQSTAI